MIHRKYLVTNIMIENNEPYKVKLPVLYSEYGPVSEPYLRTHAVNCREITYEHKEIDMTHSYDTHKQVYQSFINDLLDCPANEYVTVQVTPMPMYAMVIVLTQDEIDQDGIDLSIFMKLQEYLPIDFLIEM